jgi:hypothetical protein
MAAVRCAAAIFILAILRLFAADTGANMAANRTSPVISPEKLAELSWQDFQYRHENFWRILYRAVAAFSAILIVPLLYDNEDALAGYLFVFPILSGMLCLVSWWAMNAELRRLYQSQSVFRELMDRNLVSQDGKTGRYPAIGGLFGLPIGKVLTTAWLVAGLIVSGAALWRLLVLPSVLPS